MRGSGPLGARLNKYRGRYAEAEGRYAQTTPVRAAVAAYSGVAREAGMSPAALALRFVLSRPLVASAVMGVAISAYFIGRSLLRSSTHTRIDTHDEWSTDRRHAHHMANTRVPFGVIH